MGSPKELYRYIPLTFNVMSVVCCMQTNVFMFSFHILMKRQHSVAYGLLVTLTVVAYVLQKHPLYQIWQNPLMTLFSNASWTTHTMLYTTCSLLGANFLTILDKGITTDN